MRVKLALLADAANVSREGKLNILGIFDTIYARDLPTVHPHMALVLRLEAGSAETGRTHEVVVELAAPDGTIVFRLPGTLDVPSGGPAMGVGIDHVLAIANLSLATEGRYAFRIHADGAVAAEVPLQVERVPVRH
ncbi:MAG TPA: hypothetical protein VFD84_18120 [Candidatus Binatia bacterium]|jgi:hypothetical protein|nr:hypothetical protein [Candidatus Binatia bacterium]